MPSTGAARKSLKSALISRNIPSILCVWLRLVNRWKWKSEPLIENISSANDAASSHGAPLKAAPVWEMDEV